MSFADLENGLHLQQQLQAAIDFSKIFSVFDTFVKVINEQKKEIEDLRAAMGTEIGQLRNEMKSEITSTREELRDALIDAGNVTKDLFSACQSDLSVVKQDQKSSREEFSELKAGLDNLTTAVDEMSLRLEKDEEEIEALESLKSQDHWGPRSESVPLPESSSARAEVEKSAPPAGESEEKAESARDNTTPMLTSRSRKGSQAQLQGRVAALERALSANAIQDRIVESLAGFDINRPLGVVLEDKKKETLAECRALLDSAPSVRGSSSSTNNNSNNNSSSGSSALSEQATRNMVKEILYEYNISKPIRNLAILENIDELMSAMRPVSTSTVNSASISSNNSNQIQQNTASTSNAAAPVAPAANNNNNNNSNQADGRRGMDADKLMLVSAHKRRELLGWLKVKGKNILKERAKAKEERDKLMSVPDKLKELEEQVESLTTKIEAQRRALEKAPEKFRSFLPSDFFLRYSSLANIQARIDDSGGIDQLFLRIKLLQTELQSMNKPVTDEIKIFDSKGKLSEPFLRLVRQQLGPVEPDSDSNTIIDLSNRIHAVREEAMMMKEFDDFLQYDPSVSKIVNPRAEKLREIILTTTQDKIASSASQLSGFQMKIDPAEMQRLLREAENYTNLQVDNVATNIYNRYDETLRKLEEKKLEPLTEDVKRHENKLFELKDQLDMLGTSYGAVESRLRGSSGGLGSGAVDAAIRSQVEAFAEDARYQKEQQMKVFREMSDQVISLQNALADRPDRANVEQMIGYLETAFKRRFGGDMTNLRTTVMQIIKAVENKAGREEVATMIADRVENIEQQMTGTLMEDNSKLALATKCLACGQASMYRSRSPNRASSPDSIAVPASRSSSDVSLSKSSRGGYVMSPEALSTASSQSGISTSQAEELLKNFQDIAGGKVGLKSLQNHSTPFSPKQNPLGNSGGMKSPGSRLSTPLYQKARVSNTMRELVKQPALVATSASQQSLYVLAPGASSASAADDNNSVGSLGSRGSTLSLPVIHKSPKKSLY